MEEKDPGRRAHLTPFPRGISAEATGHRYPNIFAESGTHSIKVHQHIIHRANRNFSYLLLPSPLPQAEPLNFNLYLWVLKSTISNNVQIVTQEVLSCLGSEAKAASKELG